LSKRATEKADGEVEEKWRTKIETNHFPRGASSPSSHVAEVAAMEKVGPADVGGREDVEKFAAFVLINLSQSITRMYVH